jgi:lysophospholipase L1-like esterase
MHTEILNIRMHLVKQIELFVISVVYYSSLSAQPVYLLTDTNQYGFIDYSVNYFQLPQESFAFQNFFNKFSNLIRYGNNELDIVHIGGSHVQADIYTHRMRQNLQLFTPGLKGSRGFIFPYKIAKTNNPGNYKVTYTGQWTSCKNTRYAEDCLLGLSGMSVRLMDTSAIIQIVARFDSTSNYDFDLVKVFCNKDKSFYTLRFIPDSLVIASGFNDTLGFYWFELQDYTDTLLLQIAQPDTVKIDPEIYGFSLENNDPGVVYHSVGVNGATLQAFLQCSLLAPHLIALHPDMVVISIGTNDGYTRNFDPEKYYSEYKQFLNIIKRALPNAAILLTVPNDSYLYRKYLNRNTATMRDVILKLAKEFNCGVWDFYTVMGGLNSAEVWYNKGLMSRDRVHFNKQGYLLKGDLLFEAFIKSWERGL